MKLEENFVLGGRYRIVKPIGNINKNTTFMVTDIEDAKKTFVCKVLVFQSVKKWKELELFEREAMVLKNLHHPCIPAYVDYFEVNEKGQSLFCLVQEYKEGKNLREKIRDGYRVTESKALQISKKLLAILKYLQGFEPPVIHRDINPNNIIIDEKNKPHLVDFGAVQAAAAKDHLSTQTIIGTAGYMPMEQLVGRASPASDIYGLGVTLIFLLTHTDPINLPFENMRYDYRKLVDISDTFAEFIDICTEPNPGERFQTAVEAYSYLSDNLPVAGPGREPVKKQGIRVIHKGEDDISKMMSDKEIRKFIKSVKREYPRLYDKRFDDF